MTTAWTVELAASGQVTRTLRVTAKDAAYLVEYRGDGMGSESVWVDGEMAAKVRSVSRMTPRIDFEMGAHRASVHIRTVWWRDFLPPLWARLEAFVLEVDGEAIYVEGDWLARATALRRR